MTESQEGSSSDGDKDYLSDLSEEDCEDSSEE